jgi:hypothetical protein
MMITKLTALDLARSPSIHARLSNKGGFKIGPESATANRRERQSCLSRVFNFKLGRFTNKEYFMLYLIACSFRIEKLVSYLVSLTLDCRC